jgi:hypothetical protein
MGTGTDTTLMAVPTLDSLSGHLLFLYPLLRQFDTTMSGHIPLMIITTSKMIGYGFRDTWNIGKPPMVGKESGYLAIGNGDRINKKI